MKWLVPLLLLLAVACSDAEPPVPSPVPVPEPAAAPGPFSLVVRPGVPGRRPPVRIVGDARGVTVEFRKVVEPTLPLGGDGPGEVVSGKTLASGIYRVIAARGEVREERRLVVSDLKVILKRAAREALVWVVDARDGTPVASARVLRRHGERNRESVTDRSGVCRFEVPSEGRLEILVTRNGRVAYREDEGFPAKDVVTFLMLDQAAYGPGDEVRAAGIYRKRNGDYRLVEAPRARLLIRDERGSVVAAADAEEHEPGFFHGSVRIPAEPPAGPLDLVADLGFGEESVPLPMPRPPAVGFTAGLFQAFAGRPEGRYYFYLGALDPAGRRLTGARVLYRVERRERGRYVPVLEGRGLLPADESYFWTLDERPPGQSQVRASVIDRNGLRFDCDEAFFSDRPPDETPEPDFPMSVEPEVVEPGTEVRVSIPGRAMLAGRTVLVTLEGEGLGPHTVEKLAGPRYETSFRVPNRPGTALVFGATAVAGGKVLRGSAEARVAAESRALDVFVSCDGEALSLKLGEDAPASARGLVAVFGWAADVDLPGLRDVFYGSETTVRTLPVTAWDHLFREFPEPPAVYETTGPILWRTDIRFEDGRAVLPFELPERKGRYGVVVAVATADHRFASDLRILHRPGAPPPAATPPAPPAERLRSRSRPGPLPPGSSGCSLHLPADATDARLEILVTRGPFAALARAARAEMTRSLETTDGAIASFLPALILWRTARDQATETGVGLEDVRAAARAALARVYARQAEDGGFAPWDGALADTATTARVLEALLDASPWVEVDEVRIRRAVDRLTAVESSDDMTAALVFHALSRTARLDRSRVERRFPPKSWNGLPPRVLARLIDVWLEVDESRLPNLLGLLRRKALEGPGEMLSWSDAPGRDVETTALVAASLIEDVDGAVRFLLDRRAGASWADARTATAAARALELQVGAALPEEGEAIPLRIRVESGLVAAVRLSREELTTAGRFFVVEDGSVPRGRFEVEFTRGGDADADVVAVLTWRADDGPEAGEPLALTSTLARITMDGRTPLTGPADRGVTLLMTVEVEGKKAVGPFSLDVPLPAGTIALPAHIFDVGTPPGVGRTDRADRVRFLVPALEAGGRTKLELVVRTVFEGTFILRSATAKGLDSGAHLGSSDPATLEIR